MKKKTEPKRITISISNDLFDILDGERRALAREYGGVPPSVSVVVRRILSEALGVGDENGSDAV
jgi:hypothetical protein